MPLWIALLLAAASSFPPASSALGQCSPSQHICHGRCPPLPPGAELPHSGGEGLCLRDSDTGACVCWMDSPPDNVHAQTLFKCETRDNHTRREVMCLPPPFCFPPDISPSCLIVPHCPCTLIAGHGHLSGWYPVAALILRSKTPVLQQDTPTDHPQGGGVGDVREFSMKHLLFLLGFVIAPLLCWCLLTVFHEGKCRKKRRPSPEAQPMPTDRPDEAPCPGAAPRQVEPTAPKLVESPPPYRVTLDPGESCLLAPADCGPPPSYEDAVRNPGWPTTIRIQEVHDS